MRESDVYHRVLKESSGARLPRCMRVSHVYDDRIRRQVENVRLTALSGVYDANVRGISMKGIFECQRYSPAT